MSFPTSPGFDKTKLDAGSDDPELSRAELFLALEDLEDVIAGRGQASGIAPLDSGSKVPRSNLPFTTPIPRLIGWQFPGTYLWTVPAGCYRILVEATGGGGGGAYSSTSSHGGGGGAGGTTIKSWDVTPGDVVTVVVGTGGAGGAGPSDQAGADGGNSTVTIGATSIVGNGGQHGGGSSITFGGYGGTGSGGDLTIEGGAAQSGTTNAGGIGGSSMRAGSAPNNPAFGFGGGGYGSGLGGGDPAFSGKAGGVIIWYY